MKNLPNKFLKTKQRKEMWQEGTKIVNHLDKKLKFKEIYVIGSMISKKKNINDIDFVVVTKTNKISNHSYPLDLIILPENSDTKEYLAFFTKYMKKKYGKSFGPIQVK